MSQRSESTNRGSPNESLTGGKTHRIFLSHAAADRPLAELVRKHLMAGRPDLEVFMASKPGLIRASEEWFPAIQRELLAADAYFVLLTPTSVLRPWVWFETGAAWMSERTLIAARAAGLPADEIPLPISTRQCLSLEVEEEAAEIFAALHIGLRDPVAFVAQLRAAAATALGVAAQEMGWKGVSSGGSYFAWEGPLGALTDLQAESEPPGLLDALRRSGLTPSWARPNQLGQLRSEGKLQVFMTDRRKWRRPIAYGDTVLVVATPAESPETRAARLMEARRQGAQDERFMKSQESVQLVLSLLKELQTELWRGVESMRKTAGELQPQFACTSLDCKADLGPFSIRAAWVQKYVHAALDGQLLVSWARGYQELRGMGGALAPSPYHLGEESYELRKDASGHWAWRGLSSTTVLTSSGVADQMLQRLVDLVAAPPSNQQYPVIGHR